VFVVKYNWSVDRVEGTDVKRIKNPNTKTPHKTFNNISIIFQFWFTKLPAVTPYTGGLSVVYVTAENKT
jgi:hypothetical protein